MRRICMYRSIFAGMLLGAARVIFHGGRSLFIPFLGVQFIFSVVLSQGNL